MTIHCSFTIEFKRQKWGFHIAFFDWKGVNQKTSVRWNSSDRTFVFDIGIGQLRQWVIHFCICFFLRLYISGFRLDELYVFIIWLGFSITNICHLTVCYLKMNVFVCYFEEENSGPMWLLPDWIYLKPTNIMEIKFPKTRTQFNKYDSANFWLSITCYSHIIKSLRR